MTASLYAKEEKSKLEQFTFQIEINTHPFFPASFSNIYLNTAGIDFKTFH